MAFRAYAKRRYGITSYREFRGVFVEKGVEAFIEPLEWIHELLDELNVRMLKDYQSIEELRDFITRYRLSLYCHYDRDARRPLCSILIS